MGIEQIVSKGLELFITSTAFAFTDRQRKVIKVIRDDNKCQDPNKKIQHGGRLEVDHILPQRFAHDALGMIEEVKRRKKLKEDIKI